MKSATTVFLNGITALIADAALNDLSRRNNFANLKSYFESKGIIQAASYASVTVMIGALAVILATDSAFGFQVPSNIKELCVTLTVSFIIGFAMDVGIERFRVFDGLQSYYRTYGAGFYGGLSLVVTMIISLAVQKFLLPIL